MTNVERVEAFLAEFPAMEGAPEAGLALEMARLLDHPAVSPNAKAMCAGQYAAAMERLRALAPPKEEVDQLDDLAARRERRVATAKR